MIHLLILAVHLLATIAKLVRPGGVRAVVAESLVLKHQLLISSCARRRAPNLNSFDRLLLGFGSLFVPASRIPKLAVILKPRTLLRFREALKKRKYRWLFSSGGGTRVEAHLLQFLKIKGPLHFSDSKRAPRRVREVHVKSE